MLANPSLFALRFVPSDPLLLDDDAPPPLDDALLFTSPFFDLLGLFPLPPPSALAARCASCNALRSALLSFGFFGGMTRLAGFFFSFLAGAVAADAAAASSAPIVDT